MARAQAGPLSRFYAGLQGDPERLRPGVEAWREDLRASVAPKVAAGLQWDEGAAPVGAASLDAAGWIALRLFAFHAERPELELPDSVPPLLEFDADYRAAAEAKFPKTLYGQILACRMWLPGDFPVTLRVPLPDGETAEIGSLDLLVAQLRWLNQRSFDADADSLRAWLAVPAPPGAPLLAAAQRGFAALWSVAVAGQQASLPVVVDEFAL